MKTLTTIGLMLVLAVAWAPVQGHDHGHHASHAAGEPGDPAKPSRTVEIEMSEMTYEPIRIQVKKDEQIRFVLHNVGTEDHEFLLATTRENLTHAAMMKKHPHMAHDEPNGIRLAPKKTAEKPGRSSIRA